MQYVLMDRKGDFRTVADLSQKRPNDLIIRVTK